MFNQNCLELTIYPYPYPMPMSCTMLSILSECGSDLGVCGI